MALRSTVLWKILAAGLVVLGLAACDMDQKSSAHKKEVNAANARWLGMRSSMMLQLAQQQFDTGDLDQAEKTLADAIGIDPKNARLHILAGRIALERSQLERAYQRLGTALTLDEKLGEGYYYQGIVLQRWQRFDEALTAYQKAYDLQRDNPSFLLAITEVLVAIERVDDAIKLLSDKVVYFDQNSGVRAAMGQLYSLKKQYDKAADYYRQAALLRPDDTQLAETLALTQIEAGQYADATRNLERLCADKGHADRRDLKIALASAYERSGRLAEAREVYVGLTRSDAQDPQPWLKLGRIAWNQGDAAAALLAANRVTTLMPNSPQGYLLAGLAWQKRGNAAEALRCFDRAAELAPTSNEAVILRGITLQRAGQAEAAAKAYTEALRRTPDDARARNLLASVESPAARQP